MSKYDLFRGDIYIENENKSSYIDDVNTKEYIFGSKTMLELVTITVKINWILIKRCGYSIRRCVFVLHSVRFVQQKNTYRQIVFTPTENVKGFGIATKKKSSNTFQFSMHRLNVLNSLPLHATSIKSHGNKQINTIAEKHLHTHCLDFCPLV